MRLTELGIRALPLQDGQRDYPDDTFPGFSVRVGRRTKTFMLVVRHKDGRQRMKVGTWPDLSLSKARERARDMQAEARLAKTTVRRTTVKQAFAIYEATHLTEVRASTAKQQKRLLSKFLVTPLGNRNLGDLTTHDVAPQIDAVSKRTERYNAYVAISIFLNWCVSREYIEASPIAKLERPRAPTPRSRVLTPGELVAIWRALHEDEFGAITKILMVTAQRPTQIAALKRENIKSSTLEWSAGEMKADREHIIPLTPTVAGILKRYGNSGLL